MVLVETSVLVAIVFREEGYGALLQSILQEDDARVSTVNFAEALLVIERRNVVRGVEDLEGLLQTINAVFHPFDAPQARLAHEAFRIYGKGRHPAGLNFGDCLSYAAAKSLGARLIYVGDDFSQTDLA